jgi:hypothetical protein
MHQEKKFSSYSISSAAGMSAAQSEEDPVLVDFPSLECLKSKESRLDMAGDAADDNANFSASDEKTFLNKNPCNER